jgi:hypothetical protein
MGYIIDTDQLVSLRDAAAELDITTQWLYKLIKRGDIKTIEVAGYKMVTREELARYQESQTPVAA